MRRYGVESAFNNTTSLTKRPHDIKIFSRIS